MQKNNNLEAIKINNAQNTLLMIGMFSIIMLFAGLTSAYIVSKGSLAQYNLGLCSFSDSTLIVHTKFEGDPIRVGYFIYKTDGFGGDKVLLGKSSSVQSHHTIEASDVGYHPIHNPNRIVLKQLTDSATLFLNQSCLFVRTFL